ncbi:MAG: TIGR02221 family CRISPR-associated protein [Thermodesulfobacteriota bacterium]|nr:TIGR02221 family CRISPR-associated protein [Thermodesulfobacteriota bacterium]
MRKVFLSFLGTSDYLPCNYTCGKKTIFQNIRFVQEATIAYHCSDWMEQDAIIVFTTEESHQKNWLDNGHKDRDGNMIQLEGLQSRIENMARPFQINEVRIGIGKDEAEIWKTFATIMKNIDDGDELYFDITHAFRSLPLLAMVIINYAKVTKNITVKAIDYGALESLGQITDVRKMEVEERNVPVFNLLPFDQLLDWTTAIDGFLIAGNPAGIQKLTTKKITPVLSETQGKDEEAASLREMSRCLGTFAETMAACRGKEIVKSAKNLQAAVENVRDQELITPLAPLLVKLKENTASFTGNEVNDGLAAAKWCLKHNLIQQGFTLLQETMCSHVLLEVTDVDHYAEKNRNMVNKAMVIQSENKSFTEWDKAAQENRSLVENLCSWFANHKDFKEQLKNIGNDRNDINHAGIRDNPMAAKKFSDRLGAYTKEFEKYAFTE